MTQLDSGNSLEGICSTDGNAVTGGDAVAIEETGLITIKGAGEPSEIIVFDLT